MLLACPNCASAFRLPPGAVAAAGRVVRCSSCLHVWTAYPEDLTEEPELALADAQIDAQADSQADALPDSQTDARPSASRVVPFRNPPPDAPRAAGITPVTVEGDSDIIAIDRPIEDEDVGEVAAAPPLVPEAEVEAEPVAAPEPAVEAMPAALEPARDLATAAILAAEPAEPAEEAAPPLRRRPRHVAPARDPLHSALRTACGVLAACCAALLFWRTEVVRVVPSLAGFYATLGMPVNLRVLEFHQFKATHEILDGVPMLAIEGFVFNPAPRAVEVPKLRYSIADGAGHELYAWTAEPPKAMLGSAETFVLRSRLAAPPQNGQTVLVRFVKKRDLAVARP